MESKQSKFKLWVKARTVGPSNTLKRLSEKYFITSKAFVEEYGVEPKAARDLDFRIVPGTSQGLGNAVIKDAADEEDKDKRSKEERDLDDGLQTYRRLAYLGINVSPGTCKFSRSLILFMQKELRRKVKRIKRMNESLANKDILDTPDKSEVKDQVELWEQIAGLLERLHKLNVYIDDMDEVMNQLKDFNEGRPKKLHGAEDAYKILVSGRGRQMIRRLESADRRNHKIRSRISKKGLEAVTIYRDIPRRPAAVMHIKQVPIAKKQKKIGKDNFAFYHDPSEMKFNYLIFDVANSLTDENNLKPTVSNQAINQIEQKTEKMADLESQPNMPATVAENVTPSTSEKIEDLESQPNMPATVAENVTPSISEKFEDLESQPNMPATVAGNVTPSISEKIETKSIAPRPLIEDFIDENSTEDELAKFYEKYDPGKLNALEFIVPFAISLGRIEFNKKLNQSYGASLDDLDNAGEESQYASEPVPEPAKQNTEVAVQAAQMEILNIQENGPRDAKISAVPNVEFQLSERTGTHGQGNNDERITMTPKGEKLEIMKTASQDTQVEVMHEMSSEVGLVPVSEKLAITDDGLHAQSTPFDNHGSTDTSSIRPNPKIPSDPSFIRKQVGVSQSRIPEGSSLDSNPGVSSQIVPPQSTSAVHQKAEINLIEKAIKERKEIIDGEGSNVEPGEIIELEGMRHPDETGMGPPKEDPAPAENRNVFLP